LKFSEKAFCAADPDAIALALESRCVGVIGNDFANFVTGEIAFVSREVEFGELNFGTRIGMVLGDLLPDSDGGFGLVEGGHRFSKCHKRIAIIVLGIFSDGPFK